MVAKTVVCMNSVRKKENLFFLCLIIGWLVAAWLGNFLLGSRILSCETLNGMVQSGWQKMAERSLGTVLRTASVRTAEIALLLLIYKSRMRKTGLCLIMTAIGLTEGFWLVLLTRSKGVMGLPVYLISGFPQELCYLLAVLGLGYRCMYDIHGKSRRFLCLILCVWMLGFAGEILIHPAILKLF